MHALYTTVQTRTMSKKTSKLKYNTKMLYNPLLLLLLSKDNEENMNIKVFQVHANIRGLTSKQN